LKLDKHLRFVPKIWKRREEEKMQAPYRNPCVEMSSSFIHYNKAPQQQSVAAAVLLKRGKLGSSDPHKEVQSIVLP